MYVVEIEPGLWLAPWEGDPGRTLVIGNAERFESRDQADAAAVKAMRDMHGREVKAGDLIRVNHYIDARTGRKCYIHKLIVLADDDSQIVENGKHLYAVDVIDIACRGSLDKAFKCRLDVCNPAGFEIIDGPMIGRETWYERPKQPLHEDTAGSE